MSMWVVVLFVWLAPAILVGVVLTAMLMKEARAKGQAAVPHAASETHTLAASPPEQVRVLEVVN